MMPVLSFFQPARNIPMLADLGINTFCGPEVENAKSLTPEAFAVGALNWVKTTVDMGLKCILKRPPGIGLPHNCVGVMLSVDEPNAKWPTPVTAADLKAESDDFRNRFPGVPIYLSLAGDKIHSLNLSKPSDVQPYLDYATVADVLTIDFYSRNRDATRYPDTFPGECVEILKKITGKPVIPWLEHNDQQLKPIGGANRAPTPAEIEVQFNTAIAKGAAGIGWFSTCEAGKYGWGVTDPAKGDSYWPMIDRNGASMQPQIDTVKRLSLSLNPPPQPIDLLTRVVAEQASQIADLRGQIDTLNAKLNDPATARELLLRALTPQPSTQPTR
jgi:hypothetical protein